MVGVSAGRVGAVDLPAATAAALTAMMLGAAFVATRFLVTEASPGLLAFLRYAISSLCLMLFLWGGWRLRMRAGHALAIAFLGVLQFGVFHLAYNASLQHIPASRAAVVFSLVSLLTMLLSAAVGHEALTGRKLGGVVLAIGGVAVVVGDPQALTGGIGIGDLLILTSVFCGSTYNVLSRRYLLAYPSLPVTVVAMLGGVAYSAPVAGVEGLLAAPPQFSPLGWMALFFITVPSGALAFAAWNWALRRTAPSRVAIFLPLSPISATALGAWLLGEQITVLFLLGTVLALAGIWLAHWQGPASGMMFSARRRRTAR